LSVLNRTSFEAKDAVISGEADIAFALLEGEHAKLIHKKFKRYYERAVVASDHPLAQQQYVTATQLAKYPLLLLEAPTLSRKLLDRWFQQKDCIPGNLMNLGSVDGQLALARVGLGVALVPDFAIPNDLISVSIRGAQEREIALFYQRLKPTAQAWLRLTL
jgi:DNA-binding transcriptional LysR family regulator